MYPDFTFFNAVAGVPCLALGAAKLMERRRALVSIPAAAYAAVFVAAKGASVAAGSDIDGKVLFWNDDPAFNRVVDRLRQTPPETRVYSELWGNLNARASPAPTNLRAPWSVGSSDVDHTGEQVAKGLPRHQIVGTGRARGPAARTVRLTAPLAPSALDPWHGPRRLNLAGRPGFGIMLSSIGRKTLGRTCSPARRARTGVNAAASDGAEEDPWCRALRREQEFLAALAA